MAYQGRRVFRLGRGMTVTLVGVTLLFAAVAYGAYQSNGWTWVSIGMAVAAGVCGAGGIVESLVVRIELTDEAMIVTDR